MKDDRMEKTCRFCERAKTLSDGSVMLCEKLGVVGATFSCRRFRYDPLKRDPKRPRLEEALERLEFTDIG